MKKVIPLILTLLLAFLIAIAAEWDPVMDLLPFDRSGWRAEHEVYYYLNEDGDPLTGWQDIDGCRYFFDLADGAMHTGWLDYGGAHYRFDTNGRMLSSCWIRDDNGAYYLNADGTMATGWQDIDGVHYWFAEDGTAASGWQDIDGQRYYLNADGSAHYGWMDLDGDRYYLNEAGVLTTGWIQTGEGLFYLLEDGTAASGWLELEGARFYISEGGCCAEGWNEIDGSRYYMNADGSCRIGWQEIDETKYYFREDGSAATGKLVIDDVPCYFSSTGAYVLLVNRWNPIPDDYDPGLKSIQGWQVSAECYDELTQMLSDCPYPYTINSAYRSEADQQSTWDNRLAQHLSEGYSQEAALKLVEDYVARPGTSEHQLGLAVDLGGAEAQKWLKEHCAEYGFILRYPEGKSDVTGIAYERWHFRYVGQELAMEMKGTGLCLEEYLDHLTTDGGTAGNPDRVTDAEAAA